MKSVAKFEKVSFNQFMAAWKAEFAARDDERIREIYDEISLPRRATSGSAGYDFFAPDDFTLAPGETIKIPTGIRVKIDDGWVLMIYPRSGLGFKYRLQLDNTVGVIDGDYYTADNEGHIFCRMTNDTNADKTLSVKSGNGFCQGILMPFGITYDDEATGVRVGGFGSTDSKNLK